MDSFRLTTAAILPFLVWTPLPPSVNHFLTWKPSQAALSSPHRGFYAEDGTCERCSSPCRTCEGNANNCHSCEGGLVLDHKVCRETCPERHVAVEGVCKHCPEMCQECIHEKTCKGTWEHPRGEWGSAKPPQLGPTIWGWGIQAELGETVSLPLMKFIYLCARHWGKCGWDKVFPLWILQVNTDKSPFCMTSSPNMYWALRVCQALCKATSNYKTKNSTLAWNFFLWNYLPRKAYFLSSIRQTHLTGAILSKGFSWYNLKSFPELHAKEENDHKTTMHSSYWLTMSISLVYPISRCKIN